jgi:hypothetical protein
LYPLLSEEELSDLLSELDSDELLGEELEDLLSELEELD